MKRHLNSLLSFALLALPTLAQAAQAQHGGETAGGEHAAGNGGILGMLGIEWKGILIQIMGFILLFLILRKFLFGPLQSALSIRRSEIQGAYDRMEEQQRDLNRRQGDLEQRLIGIENEARERLLQASNEAKVLQDQILAEARTQSDRIIEQGRRNVQMEHEKALVTLREEVADLAVRAAGRVLDETLDGERHRKLVSDFISQVGS